MLADNQRLTPHHASLYFVLFQYWNLNHFRNPISISREEVMRLSTIGSVNTYLKCLKELHEWNYIRYNPPHNPQRGSKVHLYRFDTGSNTTNNNTGNTTGQQPVRPSTNNTFRDGQHAKIYCFDDLGAEQSLKYYGNKCNIMAEVLLTRYDLFIACHMQTL